MITKGFSIILPSYNEAEALPQLVAGIMDVFTAELSAFEYEIVVVDDNSPDRTAERIKSCFGGNEKVKLIVRKDERGLGSAIFRGIQEARGEYVIVMDTDFNHPPKKIAELVKNAEKYDMVCFSRYVKGGGMNTDNRLSRYWGSRAYNKFLQLYLGVETNDNLCGFFVTKKEDILKLPTDVIFMGYGEFYFGLIYFLKKMSKNFRILQLPIVYEKRRGGESKTKFRKMMWQYFKKVGIFKRYKITKKKVLVTYARNRIAYICAKSLFKAGFEVHAGDCVRFAMTFFSRFAEKKIIYTSPFLDEKLFVSDLLTYIKKNKIDIFLPTHEEGFVIAKYQQEFQGIVKLLLPSYEQIEMANNKIKAMEYANSLGLRVPRYFSFRSPEEFNHFLKGEIKFPVVLKLQKSRGSAGLNYAHSKDELKEKFNKIVEDFGIKEDYPMVQEYVEGYGLGVSMLYKNGKALVGFTHKRILELPITGGTSVERVSVHHDKSEEQAKKILDALHWNGVAMVEFRVDAKTDEPYFLEINPRFWGSLNQAVVSGVDFPLLICKTLAGEVSNLPEYKTGVKTRWLWGGAFILPSCIMHGKFREVGIILSIFRKNLFFDDFSWSDPLPFFVNPIIPFFNLLVRGKITFEKKEEEVKNFNA